MQKIKITYGGWYQRTVLHLDEIYDFIISGKSKTKLNENRLKLLRDRLEIIEIHREVNYIECLYARTKDGIAIRYYEDGTYLLEIETDDVKKAQSQLERYSKQRFNPALEYLFSLGAPTPKILANIKSVHTIIITAKGSKSEAEGLMKKIAKTYEKKETKEAMLYVSQKFQLLSVAKNGSQATDDLVENAIFFRECKSQLEKYLQIHRILWEEISHMKSQKEIGKVQWSEMSKLLDDYQTAISLISSRINQLQPYLQTRATISRHAGIEQSLSDLFQYKFESLADALEYSKETWKATAEYLASAMKRSVEIREQELVRELRVLQFVLSIVVASGLVGYFSEDGIFQITTSGFLHLLVIILVAWLLNGLITRLYRRKPYQV